MGLYNAFAVTVFWVFFFGFIWLDGVVEEVGVVDRLVLGCKCWCKYKANY